MILATALTTNPTIMAFHDQPDASIDIRQGCDSQAPATASGDKFCRALNRVQNNRIQTSDQLAYTFPALKAWARFWRCSWRTF
jgi:hypothetical protein